MQGSGTGGNGATGHHGHQGNRDAEDADQGAAEGSQGLVARTEGILAILSRFLGGLFNLLPAAA
jgi:hypothetical protein